MLNIVGEIILDIFTKFNANDEQILNRLSVLDDDIYIKNEVLIFSLTGLYRFLNNNNYVSADNVTYQEFRKHIYASDINYRLSEIGLRIDIHDSSSKIDTSYYKLSKLVDEANTGND